MLYITCDWNLAGLHNCTMNVHLLRHLTHYVRLYGPLWTHSCFWFESMNGQLLRLKHGTHHTSLQVYIGCFEYILIVIQCVAYNYNLQVQAQWRLTKSLAVADSSHFDSDSDSAKVLLRQLNGHNLR